jgi:hypothetical protein
LLLVVQREDWRLMREIIEQLRTKLPPSLTNNPTSEAYIFKWIQTAKDVKSKALFELCYLALRERKYKNELQV